MIPQTVQNIEGKTFQAGEKSFVVQSVDDFIHRELAAGIPNAYAVVTTTENESLTLFECGEVQREDGTFIGELQPNPFHPQD